LKDEKAFNYDPDTIIDVREGLNFYDILGRMYLNELETIYRKGFYKKYVRKEEDIRYLRGKIILREQIKNNISKKSSFYCSYEDLTYDNAENQIILKAVTLLVPLIRFNERIKRDLIMYRLIMSEVVSLQNITPEDCERIQYNRLNEHYGAILAFSKLILRHHFIRSVQKGSAFGFNFIVNMNRVYEDFITTLLEELTSEDRAFEDYVIEKQARFDSLVKEKEIITRPDVILRRRDTNRYPLIIDAKYKARESNADYYQVIAYALALPGSETCCLIYPDEPDIKVPPILTLNTKPFERDGREVKIHTIKIDLRLDEELWFEDYIKKIKTEMRTKITNCLSDVN
jgi:5-methylcytosine-specific restriction enzyme subunit McrC